MLKPSANSKAGQSIVEFLPAVLLFFMVVTAAMSYFRTLRQVAMRQEVVRNLAFAKIANSGTLTTPGEQVNTPAPQVNGVRTGDLQLRRANEPGRAIAAVRGGQQNPFVSSQSECFRVLPHEPETTSVLAGIYGLPEATRVRFSSASVVYRGFLGRRPTGRCGP